MPIIFGNSGSHKRNPQHTRYLGIKKPDHKKSDLEKNFCPESKTLKFKIILGGKK